MTFRNDHLTDSVDRFRREQAHVVTNSPPFEFGFFVPQADSHNGSQLDVIFTQIVQLIVRQVAAQPNARKYQHVPVIQTVASTVRARIGVHILTDQIKNVLRQIRLAIHLLQGSQDRNNAVATVEIQLHLINGHAVQPHLF